MRRRWIYSSRCPAAQPAPLRASIGGGASIRRRASYYTQLVQVNEYYASMLREDHEFSYLSNRPRTVFFRELSVAYPELLDLLCTADDGAITQVQQAIRFICSAIEATNERPSDHKPLYTAVHEWLVGPIIELLSFEDDADRRKALSKLLLMLVPTFNQKFTGLQRRFSNNESVKALQRRFSNNESVNGLQRRFSKVRPSVDSELVPLDDLELALSSTSTSCSPERDNAVRAIYKPDKLNDAVKLEDSNASIGNVVPLT